jgi:hypothetical protein
MGFSAEEANSLALASDAFGGNLLDARKEAIEQVKAVIDQINLLFQLK